MNGGFTLLKNMPSLQHRLEVLEAIREPQRIVAGNAGELLAIRTQRDGKLLVVVYR
jgi:hypothetical protein